MMGKINTNSKVLEVNLWPLSTNTLYRNVHGRTVMSKRGRSFYADGLQRLGVCQMPITGRVSVCIKLYPPDKRRFDIDNRAKVVLDLLTKAQVWIDDDQVDRLIIERCDIVKPGKFTVEIQEWPIE